jgi:hypothetical protein
MIGEELENEEDQEYWENEQLSLAVQDVDVKVEKDYRDCNSTDEAAREKRRLDANRSSPNPGMDKPDDRIQDKSI